jgi:broad specificity phosphatase PhoE
MPPEPRDQSSAIAILMRHGETAWNRERRIMGDLDIPLTDEGRAQCAAAAELVERFGIDRIVTSPLRRAAETAAIVAERLRVDVREDARLVEVRFGDDWQGKTYAEVAGDPRYVAFASDPVANATPGGDTAASVQQRGIECVTSIAAGECVLFVTHGDIIRTMLCHFLATPLEAYRRIRTDNGGLSAIALRAGAPEIKFLNMLADPLRARSHTHWSGQA